MTRLLDKALLVFLSAIILMQDKVGFVSVGAFGAVICISFICRCVRGKHFEFIGAISGEEYKLPLDAVLQIGFVILCLFRTEFLCASLLIIYDVLWDRKPILAGFVFAALVNVQSFSEMQLFIMAFGVVTALILYKRTSYINSLENEIIRTRDSSAESTMLLTAKNRELYESQAYEINLATLKERNRIAREIHDNVGHMLTRSILQVGALIVINKDEAQKQALESLKDTLDSAMTSIRKSVHNLHDESIDLKQTISEALRQLEISYKINFEYDCSEDIPKNIKFCFIGIVKESLANIVRHSTANEINLTVREHPAFYQLVIKDNGKCKEIKSDGMGLSNMEERAKALGGRISFTPSKEGFRVFLTVDKKVGTL